MSLPLRPDELDLLVRQQLADPRLRESPLYDSLQALWTCQQKQISRQEQICRLSDTYHALSRERELLMNQRFERQRQQLTKVMRISDHYQNMMRDLTAKLKVMASHDVLTGLVNRRKAEQVLEQEYLRSRRYLIPLTLVMFDVDHFKNINDRFGHVYGDRVLKMVAKAAHSTLRNTDVLARWGGEEFVIVAQHTDVAGGMVLAQKVRQAVVQFSIPSVELVTVSLGVAQLQRDETIDQLLRRSDQAMYLAKEQGRDRVIEASVETAVNVVSQCAASAMGQRRAGGA